MPPALPILSVCVATMNRTRQLDAQIASLLDQTDGKPVEIVVVDATHPAEASNGVWRSNPAVKYQLVPNPSGVDRDYDRAVRAATGRFCWLLPDDDRLRANAIERILAHLDTDPDLLLLNAAVYDADLSTNLRERMLRANVPHRLQAPVTASDLAPCGHLLTFIGCVVIKRSVWLERMEERFLGSEFAHVGAILSKPFYKDVIVDREPFLDVRYGAGHWEKRWAQVWHVQWPDLIDSVVTRPELRASFYARTDWSRVRAIGEMRAYGVLGRKELQDLTRQRPFGSRIAACVAYVVSIIPSRLANGTLRALVNAHRGDTRLIKYDLGRAHSRA